MGQVAATCDEPTPAEAEAPEVPIRSEVEQYFELPDADIEGDVLHAVVAKARSALAKSLQHGKTIPRDTGDFSEL